MQNKQKSSTTNRLLTNRALNRMDLKSLIHKREVDKSKFKIDISRNLLRPLTHSEIPQLPTKDISHENGVTPAFITIYQT